MDPNETKNKNASTASAAKGTKYRAITNVSLGKGKGMVTAGEIFQFDEEDDDNIKKLVDSGAISTKLEPTPEEIKNQTQPKVANPNVEPANASATRGQQADAAKR